MSLKEDISNSKMLTAKRKRGNDDYKNVKAENEFPIITSNITLPNFFEETSITPSQNIENDTLVEDICAQLNEETQITENENIVEPDNFETFEDLKEFFAADLIYNEIPSKTNLDPSEDKLKQHLQIEWKDDILACIKLRMFSIGNNPIVCPICKMFVKKHPDHMNEHLKFVQLAGCVFECEKEIMQQTFSDENFSTKLYEIHLSTYHKKEAFIDPPSEKIFQIIKRLNKRTPSQIYCINCDNYILSQEYYNTHSKVCKQQVHDTNLVDVDNANELYECVCDSKMTVLNSFLRHTERCEKFSLLPPTEKQRLVFDNRNKTAFCTICFQRVSGDPCAEHIVKCIMAKMKCYNCNKMFSRKHLQSHIRKCTGNHKCVEGCFKNYNTEQLLTKHQENCIHVHPTRIQCVVCKQMFDEEAYKMHAEICKECVYKCGNVYVREHTKKRHESKCKHWIPCVCNKRFETEVLKKLHQKSCEEFIIANAGQCTKCAKIVFNLNKHQVKCRSLQYCKRLNISI